MEFAESCKSWLVERGEVNFLFISGMKKTEDVIQYPLFLLCSYYKLGVGMERFWRRTMFSTWWVWGNISTGWTAVTW